MWPAAIAVVVLLGVIAVVATRGGSSSTTTSGVLQTRPVTVTGTALPAQPATGTDPAIGMEAPELRGAAFDGGAVAVTHDGRAKLLVFAAHWCPHCQREIPIVAQHLLGTGMPAAVDIVLVSTSTSEARPNYPPSRWLAVEDWPAPILADDAQSTAGQAYGLSAFPYFVAIGGNGKVVARTTGEIAVATFDQLVASARAGS